MEYNPSRQPRLQRQKWIMDQLRTGAPLTRGDVERRFGVSVRSAADDIALINEIGAWSGLPDLVRFDHVRGSYVLSSAYTSSEPLLF